MQTLLEKKLIYGDLVAVFRVPTLRHGDVFMRVARTGRNNEKRAVVEVDSDKFLSLWRKEPFGHHATLSHGSCSTWEKDYKFGDAKDGFSKGRDNPVPLALVHCEIYKLRKTVERRRFLLLKQFYGYEHIEFPFVTFTNGITRTIWLLASGAKFFPVECSMRDAELLQSLAGLQGGDVQTVDNLLPSSLEQEMIQQRFSREVV